jgi:hypothetical protein
MPRSARSCRCAVVRPGVDAGWRHGERLDTAIGCRSWGLATFGIMMALTYEVTLDEESMVHGGDSTLPRPRAVGNRHRGRCDASVGWLAHLGLRRGWLKPLALSPHACAFLSTGSISGRDPIAREAKAAMRTHMPALSTDRRNTSLS